MEVDDWDIADEDMAPQPHEVVARGRRSRCRKRQLNFERESTLLFSFSAAADYLTPTTPLTDGQTLVSFGGKFELGFFSPGTPDRRYLGIWYKQSPKTVVWVANRNNPIGVAGGVLRIVNGGQLILLNQTQNILWSSNSSKLAPDPRAQLLNTGNFAVMDQSCSASSGCYVWQSFEHPTDTKLPGMCLGRSLHQGPDIFLTSWKSPEDPSPGDFVHRFKYHGLSELVINKGSILKFRSGPWNGVRLSGIIPFEAGAYVLNFRNNVLYGFCQAYNSSYPSRVVMSSSGSVDLYLLHEGMTEWNLFHSYPNSPCDNYGKCGANGFCSLAKQSMCDCLKGFTPKVAQKWELFDWSDGCVRRVPLNCSGGSVGQNRKKRVLLAVAFSGASGMLILGLLLWCMISRKQRNIEGEDLLKFNPSVSLSACKEVHNEVNKTKTNNTGFEIPLFSFSSVSAAADNFSLSNKLGEGGFGPVYKGKLLSGEEVAIKRLSTKSKQGWDELKNEAELIAKLQHKNLVKLLGCCIEGEENILVYEYLPNKSLDIFLFDSVKHGSIDWTTRVRIIEGIAQGLLYLHQYSRLTIIHRDLKASNILLDKDMYPKISDFGMARIFGKNGKGATSRIVGTYGYMAPEYASEGIFSVKSDVFSFGVLLLEILVGKRNTSFYQTDFLNLLGYAWDLWTRGKVLELKDANLQETGASVDSLFTRYIQVALLCVHQHPIERPTMSEVVLMLSNEQYCLPSPKQPAFSMLRSLVDPISQKSKLDNFSVNVVTASIVEGR